MKEKYLVTSSLLIGRKPTSYSKMYFYSLADVLSYFNILKSLGYKYDSLFNAFVYSRGKVYSLVTIPYEISTIL